jgi:hypothetical protein
MRWKRQSKQGGTDLTRTKQGGRQGGEGGGEGGRNGGRGERALPSHAFINGKPIPMMKLQAQLT